MSSSVLQMHVINLEIKDGQRCTLAVCFYIGSSDLERCVVFRNGTVSKTANWLTICKHGDDQLVQACTPLRGYSDATY